MMRLFSILAVTVFTDVLKAHPQANLGQASGNFYNGVGGDYFSASSDGSLMVGPAPTTYDGSGIAEQLNHPTLAELSISPDAGLVAPGLTELNDLDISDDLLFAPSIVVSAEPSLAEVNFETAYTGNTDYDDSSSISYDQTPQKTWPSNDRRIVFPFNCWKENKYGYLCMDNHCQMDTAASPPPRPKILIDYFRQCSICVRPEGDWGSFLL
jgi:hypothetical protein